MSALPHASPAAGNAPPGRQVALELVCRQRHVGGLPLPPAAQEPLDALPPAGRVRRRPGRLAGCGWLWKRRAARAQHTSGCIQWGSINATPLACPRGRAPWARPRLLRVGRRAGAFRARAPAARGTTLCRRQPRSPPATRQGSCPCAPPAWRSVWRQRLCGIGEARAGSEATAVRVGGRPPAWRPAVAVSGPHALLPAHLARLIVALPPAPSVLVRCRSIITSA